MRKSRLNHFLMIQPAFLITKYPYFTTTLSDLFSSPLVCN